MNGFQKENVNEEDEEIIDVSDIDEEEILHLKQLKKQEKKEEPEEEDDSCEIPEYDISTTEFAIDRYYISYEQQKKLFEKRHFKVLNPTLFCYEFINEKGELNVVETKSFMITYAQVKYAKIKKDKNGKDNIELCNFIITWNNDPKLRYYDKFIFNPNPEYEPNPRFYNYFTGFDWNKNNCIENKENIQPFLDHLKNRLCSGNEEYYNYLIQWMAHLIQFPHKKAGVALVMKSKPGAGKGIVVNKLMNIMGLKYFAQPSDQNDVLGNFNGILKGIMLLYLDELSWGGDKSAAGKLKKIITETMMSINQKNIATYMIDNYMNTIISSNEDWVIPAIPGERRFFVLQVSDELSGSVSLEKKKIIDEILNCKPEHLGHFLYNLDLSDFNIRKVPLTEALHEQQVNSYSGIKKWWMDVLDNGIEGINIDSEEGFLKEEIYDNFNDSKFGNKFMNTRVFWKELKKFTTFEECKRSNNKFNTISNEDCLENKRIRIIKFGNIKDLKELFTKSVS